MASGVALASLADKNGSEARSPVLLSGRTKGKARPESLSVSYCATDSTKENALHVCTAVQFIKQLHTSHRNLYALLYDH